MIDSEITCMRDAASPFMMRFYGEFDEGGESFMLLECLGGGSLEDLLGNGTGMRGGATGCQLSILHAAWPESMRCMQPRGCTATSPPKISWYGALEQASNSMPSSVIILS